MDEAEQKCVLIAVVFLVCFIAAAATIKTVYGTTLSKEPPPPPSLYVNGSTVDLSADDKDIDISIDPNEPIVFTNGTLTIPTEGATDSDMQGFPPVGTTVIIHNDSVIVTKNQVQIVDPSANLAIATEPESNSDGNGGGSSDEGDEE